MHQEKLNSSKYEKYIGRVNPSVKMLRKIRKGRKGLKICAKGVS